jgi:hypothetical protein
VGKRVGVWVGSPTVNVQGVIVELLAGVKSGCVVLLDDWDHPLEFYWHEVTAPRAVVFDTGSNSVRLR